MKIFSLVLPLLLTGTAWASHARAEGAYTCAIMNKIPPASSLQVKLGVHVVERKIEKIVMTDTYEECESEARKFTRQLIKDGKYFRRGTAVFKGPTPQTFTYDSYTLVSDLVATVPKIKGQKYTLKDCEVPEMHDHAVANDGSFLLPDCTPDTLYTWMPQKNAEALQEVLRNVDQTEFQFTEELNAARNPLSRYAYGNIMVRIKLKPGTKIAFVSDLPTDPVKSLCKDNDGVVAQYSLMNSYDGDASISTVSYRICSTRDIESISSGTRKNFEEAIHDFQWIRSHYPQDYDLWFKYSKLHGNKNIDSLYFNDRFDSQPWDEDMLQLRILRLQITAEDEGGSVITHSNDLKSAQSHYHTDKPTYFNP